MYNIIFKTLPSNGIGTFGFGLCSFTEACPEPVKLTDVNGTITITDDKNKLTLNIVNDVISIPILIDDDIVGKTNITIQELKSPATNGFGTGSKQQKETKPFSFGGFGQPFDQPFGQPFGSENLITKSGQSASTKIEEPTERFYQLSIGKLFKTKFYVRNNEFHAMAKEMSDGGNYNGNPGNRNVIEMNISFKTESGLQLLSNSPK